MSQLEIMYYGYFTNYAAAGFSVAAFQAQFSQSVFQYRFLGTTLLFSALDLVKMCGCTPGVVPVALQLVDNTASPQFYFAYFLLNTTALCLVATTLYWLLDQYQVDAETGTREVTLFAILSLIAISEYAVTPYDILSYFWLLLSVAVLLARSNWTVTLVAAAITIIATLTRESAILIPAFYATLHASKLRSLSTGHIMQFSVITLAFVVPYLGLRLISPAAASFFESVKLQGNLFGRMGQVGMLFLVVMVVLWLSSTANWRRCTIFLLAASPYLVAVTVVGVTWEIRLWVPVLVILAILRLPLRSDATTVIEAYNISRHSNDQTIGAG